MSGWGGGMLSWSHAVLGNTITFLFVSTLCQALHEARRAAMIKASYLPTHRVIQLRLQYLEKKLPVEVMVVLTWTPGEVTSRETHQL